MNLLKNAFKEMMIMRSLRHRVLGGLMTLTLLSCQEYEGVQNVGLQVLDPNLIVELVVEQPNIATPIGLVIDQSDALYVLESHTHSPPRDYDGPAFDRIKKGIDHDGDGIPEEWTIFADSIGDGMNLAIDEEQILYLTTKNSLLAFRDLNNDGKCDRRDTLLQMIKPDYVYDHAGILGVAIGPDDWVYISRGNTGSQHWIIEGSDQATIEGYGDGGNVMRCKRNGTKLEEVATGYWNPFDIKFTREGRLLLTDNDPDSRGPNRLIEVVPGGNYGYQSLFGESGIHPYLAWNGEFPGTLPYAAPLGEAPCALIDAAYTNFGPTYANSVLVNIWEENNIVRIPLQQKGSTITGLPKVLVQGDDNFHPVALATNSRGELYVTDWIIRQYPNHGHGRILRISSKRKEQGTKAKSTINSPLINRFQDQNRTVQQHIEQLSSKDPFERAVARRQLIGAAHQKEVLGLLAHPHANLRLEGLLILFDSEQPIDQTQLQQLLKDTSQMVVRTALAYTGTKMRADLADFLLNWLVSGEIPPAVFETYLATVQQLQPVFIEGYLNKTETASNQLKRPLPPSFIPSILQDKTIEGGTKAQALPYLKEVKENQSMLIDLLRTTEDPTFQSALIKSLRTIVDDTLAEVLLEITANKNNDEGVRAQAVASLTVQIPSYCENMIALLPMSQPLLQKAVLKYLCRCRTENKIEEKVEEAFQSAIAPEIKVIWENCTQSDAVRPSTTEGWARTVTGDGDPYFGRLVFESLHTQCQTCHKVNGWGGTYGPDLSRVGSSKSRQQLVNAILLPSLEIAPDWQGWYVVDAAGNTHLGRQIDVHLNSIDLMNQNGEFDNYVNPKEFGVIDASLMPEGLQNLMSTLEFNDLIAYLESLK